MSGTPGMDAKGSFVVTSPVACIVERVITDAITAVVTRIRRCTGFICLVNRE